MTFLLISDSIQYKEVPTFGDLDLLTIIEDAVVYS